MIVYGRLISNFVATSVNCKTDRSEQIVMKFSCPGGDGMALVSRVASVAGRAGPETESHLRMSMESDERWLVW